VNTLQVNIFILSAGVIQGLFLFLLLHKKRNSIPGYYYLAAYWAVMLLQVTMKIADKLWLMQHVRPLYSFSYQLPYLYGPLAWLFIRQVTRKHSFRAVHLLHFIPTFVIIVSLICIYADYSLPAFLSPLFHTRFAMILQLISLVAYHGLAFYELKKYKQGLPAHLAGLYKTRVNWQRQFLTGSFIVCSVIAIALCVMYSYFPRGQNFRFAFAALTLFIYWISYKAWSQPELFNVVLGKAEIAAEKLIPQLTIHRAPKKYSNSGLHDSEMEKIVVALENKLRMDRCYLDAQLAIDDLALSLGCSRHHLSQAMNEKLGKSFYDCINEYRVEEAKSLLADPSRTMHKIASIAYDAGFNSLSTFNDVFKKSTGFTPSQFRKQQEEKNLQKQRV